MAIRFNSELLIRDLDLARKRKKISIQRAARRMQLHETTIYHLKAGRIKEITVTTLVRILDFLGTTDIHKYIYNDNDNDNGE